MARHYKLRLGDGTVLSVDQDGLKTWAADRRATVQAVGSWRWQPLHEVLAEEEAAARLARALVPPTPRQETTPPPPVTPPPPPVAPPRPAQIAQPAFSEPSFGGLSFGEPAFSEPPVAAAARPGLQALADDPVPSRFSDLPAEAASDDMPIIRMKPLDDEPVYSASWSPGRVEDEGEDELAEEGARYDRLEGPLLTLAEKLGGFLSRCLDGLTPLAARLTSGRGEASRPRVADVGAIDVPRKAAARVGAASTVLTLADDPAASRALEDEPGDTADRPTPYARVLEWMRGLRARVRRPERAEPKAPKREPDWPSPPSFAPARKPLAAPAPLSELPVLRFVESREPPEPADVYEGDEPSFVLRLQPVWLWTKRLVTMGALVAALVYAFLERDSWLPRTAELGQTVFTQIDRQVLSRERSQQQQRALADAASRLPELAPETISLVFARSPTGTVEAGEVFQVAREAADRGLGALTKAEAQELRALARELLATLSRTEAERVREYDRTRTRRVIFPFENPHVMELVGRGARALPAERLERLQALSHKAVAAGLDLPEATGAPSVTR